MIAAVIREIFGFLADGGGMVGGAVDGEGPEDGALAEI